MNHQPKEDFYYFTSRLKRFAKTHKDKKDLHSYMNKLRNHYKGDDLIDEFNQNIVLPNQGEEPVVADASNQDQ